MLIGHVFSVDIGKNMATIFFIHLIEIKDWKLKHYYSFQFYKIITNDEIVNVIMYNNGCKQIMKHFVVRSPLERL